MTSAPREITAEALRASGWQDVIATAESTDCYTYMKGFSAARAAAEDAGDPSRADALALLADACAPMLWPDRDEVLGPRHLVDAIPGQHIDVLASIVTEITDPELRARVADIVWLRRHAHRAAEIAIQAYVAAAVTSEDPTDWTTCFARTERALRLAATLGKGNALFTEVIAHIEQALARLGGRDSLYLSAKLMELLLEHRIGDGQKYGGIASTMAASAASEHDWWRADTLYTTAARWFDLAKDTAAARASRVSAAESFVLMAAEKAAAGQCGVAAVHLQQAVEAYRRIGKEQPRVEALLQLMREHQERAVGEFHSFSTTVDLSDEVKRGMASVRGKATLMEAVVALAMLSASPNVATMRDSVRESARESPMQFLFPRVVVDAKTGRTTGQRDAAVANAEGALESATFEHAQMLQHLTACMIEPSRRLVCEEHHVRDLDLLPLVRSSPFVPPGREERFARGLAAGLRGDFMVAAALLVPQIENSLRFVVEQHGGRAYGLSDDGIQDAHQLDHLLGLDFTKQLLGDDIVFDLRGLLIDRFGSTLRHLEAHGLLDDGQYRSTTVAYFWWLTLRLCVVFALVASGRAPPAAATTESTA